MALITILRSSGETLRRTLVALVAASVAIAAIGCDGSGAGDPAATPSAPEEALATLYGERIPEGASLREILEHPDIFERTQRIAHFLQRATPDQLDDIRYEFETAAQNQGDLDYALFGSWWARFDPLAAFYYADQHLRMENPRVILEIVRTWAYEDPMGLSESGVLLSYDMHMPALDTGLVDAMVVGWFESGKPGLDDFIFTLNDSAARATALKAWVRMRVLRDGDAETLEWIQNASYHAEVRRQLLAGALSVIAHQNPELAVAWYEKAKEGGVDVGTLIPRIANAWGHHDPRAAIDWVLTFPDDHERTRAMQQVARKWVKRDQAEMAEWLDGKVGNAGTDMLRFQAIRAHVRLQDYRVDWADLMRRATELVDTNKRNSLVLWVLQRWYVADEAGAEAWSDANPDLLPGILMQRARMIGDKDREKIEAALSLQSTS